jgi:hypothetical protein
MLQTLNDQELRDLSGYARADRQTAWLKQQRIPFLLDKDGRPKVLRATVEAVLGPAANQSGPQLRFAK